MLTKPLLPIITMLLSSSIALAIPYELEFVKVTFSVSQDLNQEIQETKVPISLRVRIKEENVPRAFSIEDIEKVEVFEVDHEWPLGERKPYYKGFLHQGKYKNKIADIDNVISSSGDHIYYEKDIELDTSKRFEIYLKAKVTFSKKYDNVSFESNARLLDVKTKESRRAKDAEEILMRQIRTDLFELKTPQEAFEFLKKQGVIKRVKMNENNDILFETQTGEMDEIPSEVFSEEYKQQISGFLISQMVLMQVSLMDDIEKAAALMKKSGAFSEVTIENPTLIGFKTKEGVPGAIEIQKSEQLLEGVERILQHRKDTQETKSNTHSE